MANKRLRLALCITELEVGGAERCLVELATRIDRERFMPVVYCLGPRPAASSLPNDLDRAGIDVHCLGGASVWYGPSVLRKLTRRLRQQQAEVMQTFLFHANVAGAWAARRAGVAHVISGIRVAERRRWHLRMTRWADRWIERHVCVSDDVAEYSAVVGGLPRKKLLVIPNGVDVARYPAPVAASLVELGLPAGRRAILFAGRLSEQKGLSAIVPLLPALFEQLPHHDLLVAGAGPERASLAELAQRHGVADRVHFAGFRSDVPELLAACDLLILPSLWEGMANVVLEAMASGKPVVANDVEGVRQALGPLAGEQMATTTVGPEFVARVVRILSDPQKQADLGRKNRLRAEQSLGVDAMVAAYERLYESLMHGAPPDENKNS